MARPLTPWFHAAATVALVLSLEGTAAAQKTDVVTLANGDRITGEITRLERGRLVFDTDDAGKLYLEWDKLVSLVAANRTVEVVTSDDRRFVGTLMPAPNRSLAVVTPQETVSLLMVEVTVITPIGRSFWSKLDGSIDVGFSYTQSSGIAQLNLNSDTIYRRPAFQGRVTASTTITQQEEEAGGRDDRGSVDISYLRYPWQRWFFAAASRFETNESLGLELRSQIGGAVGPRLVNSNRAQMAVGAGVAFNDERGVDVESTRNVEALLMFQFSFFTYDRPKTNVDVATQYYPSLSNPGRQRLQFDSAIKREFLKDLYLSLNLYETFDSEPPNPDAEKNDFGVVASIGWSY
jgi:uncharacterized protein DUF481